jgi:hypothetical protein
MTERAAHLVDAVLPWVPVRQWVLTVPYRLRYQMAWNHGLSRAVLRVYTRVLLDVYARGARARGGPGGRTGSVTVMQRFGYRRSYCDLLHEQSLERPRSYGSGASQRSREVLEPRGGVLGDLQPPHPTVRLEIVALALHQPAPDPGTDHVQRHTEALGRSRHGVASIGKMVWKELAPRSVGRDPADPLFLPSPADRPCVPGETSPRPHPVRVEDLGDLLVVPPGSGQAAQPLEGGRRRPEEIAPVGPRHFDLGHRPALPRHLDPRRPPRHLG